MAAATTVVPFPPAQDRPGSDAVTRGPDELVKTPEAPRGPRERFQTGVRRHGNTFVKSSCTTMAAAALGIVNGRFGGEEGVVQRWGLSVDAAVALAGHMGGFALSLADNHADPNLDVLAAVFHTVGDIGLASGVYRFFHRRGVSAKRTVSERHRGRL